MITHLQPPTYDVRLTAEVGRVTPIFLAGPIQGAPDWQAKAAAYLQNLWHTAWGDLIICNPRRSDASWAFQFAQQVDWESCHLTSAARHGSILFWLANEQTHDCARAYAQTTRFELGEWIVRAPDKVVIGIDSTFPGAKYIRHRLAKMPLYGTLEDTCRAAVAAARSYRNTGDSNG